MKCIISIFTTIVLLFGTTDAWSQTTDTLQIQADDALLESLAEDAAAGAQAAEILARLSEQPLDVNAASAVEIAALPRLTPEMARRIVAYRDEHGRYDSLATVARAIGIRPELLSPYLSVANIGGETPGFLESIDGAILQRIGRRIEAARGYVGDTAAYAGSPYGSYTRIRLEAGRLKAGLAFEKDPGEAFQWAPNQAMLGYDHWTGYLSWESDGWLPELVVGNFGVQFGQGMLLWSGVSFGKGRYAVHPLLRSGGGVSAFASSRENAYLRGVAVTIAPFNNLRVSLFASRRKRDASLDLAEEGVVVRSLVAGGLHRTQTEQARRNNLRETLIGSAVEWRNAGWLFGAAGYGARLSLPFGAGTRPDEYYDLSGATLGGISVYGNGAMGPGYLYFEVMRDREGTWGAVGGAHFAAGRGADVLLALRHYPTSFRSLHGSAFGAGSGAPSNESGAYLGLRIQLHRRWILSAYADYYRFPYLRFQTPGPSSGLETRLVITHEWRDWLHWYVQVRSERRETDQPVLSPDSHLMEGLGTEVRQSARIHGTFSFNERLRLRARLEVSRYRLAPYPAEHGLLLYHQFRWEPFDRLTLYGRLTFFDVKSYNARIYAYENDLLYSFSVPVFQGKGRRYFLLARLDVTKRGTLEVKWSATHYENVREIGSGWELIDGARRRALYAQVRWRF